MGLNATKVAQQGGGKKQDDLEVAGYPGRLVQVIDLGLQTQRPYKGEEKAPVNEIMTTYELVTEFCKDDDGNDQLDRPRWISETFSFHHIGADLAKSTKRAKILDPALVHGGDWAAMLDTPTTINVVHNPNQKKPGEVYVNIGSISAPMKGFEVPPLVNPSKFFDLDEPDLEVFKGLPQWIQDKIKGNLNFEGSVLQAALEGKEAPPADEGEGEDDNPY